MSRVAAALASLASSSGSADADPSPDATQTVDASPADGASGEGSASADATTPADGGESASPEATNPNDALRAKLQAEKHRRATKRERYAARRAREAAEQQAKQLEADRAEVEKEKSKWSRLGKDGPILDVIREAGRNPQEVFEAMRDEALKAGTPEAKIEALEKAYQARLDELEKQMKADREERDAAARAAKERAEAHAFESDFHKVVARPEFEPLLEEYEPSQLFHVVSNLKNNLPHVAQEARRLGVALTYDDGSITMIDILSVMRATQAAHEARKEQRRSQRAAPQTSQAAPKQAPSAKASTVNGTEVRNAGTTIGNDLASARGGQVDRSDETRSQRLKRMIAEGKG